MRFLELYYSVFSAEKVSPALEEISDMVENLGFLIVTLRNAR